MGNVINQVWTFWVDIVEGLSEVNRAVPKYPITATLHNLYLQLFKIVLRVENSWKLLANYDHNFKNFFE